MLELQSCFNNDEGISLHIPVQARADMIVCCKIIMAAGRGLPIAARPSAPPLNALKFTSDAAGAVMGKVGGVLQAMPSPLAIGAASISLDQDENLCFVSRISWPSSFINEARDS